MSGAPPVTTLNVRRVDQSAGAAILKDKTMKAEPNTPRHAAADSSIPTAPAFRGSHLVVAILLVGLSLALVSAIASTVSTYLVDAPIVDLRL